MNTANKVTRYRGFTYKIVPIWDNAHRPTRKTIGYLISLFSSLSSGNCIRFPYQTKLIGCSYEQAEEETMTRINELMEARE